MIDDANNISFEELVIQQSTTLITCQPRHFDATFREVAKQALAWFNIDRLTLYPNSMILLNDGKTVSVSRDGVPELDKQMFLPGNYQDYMKLLRSKSPWHSFTADEMVNHKIDTLKILHSEGGRWHGIIRLELFGQNWGALSFSKFNSGITPLTDNEMTRLKLLCDIWLCYWQHSTMTRNLKQDQSDNANEGEKLLLLSKKQCSVLTLLAQGYTAKQCAEKLFLSPRTIESHKYRMLDLLELENHTELVQFALRNGLGIEQ
ncbi:LuxR C-terminal-related transcriptional regulator [Vibrio sp. ZSDE26]|uniref:LuxR C-terminal-related transcriptional regulator n=1 Tax=Vibrio amylolyticus TaxID=2847292 RepID=A0A9X2BH14_9VIBR|nr:LuxR C-terminal-related transcriptional regulator [Vibrio amylolyticus]MCK6263466.1 LuxR C-terminal-related transcriptional regulator [Vibrio amylolyticus]